MHCLSPHSRKRTNRLDNAVPPDLAHAAYTRGRLDLVRAERGARGERHGLIARVRVPDGSTDAGKATLFPRTMPVNLVDRVRGNPSTPVIDPTYIPSYRKWPIVHIASI